MNPKYPNLFKLNHHLECCKYKEYILGGWFNIVVWKDPEPTFSHVHNNSTIEYENFSLKKT